MKYIDYYINDYLKLQNSNYHTSLLLESMFSISSQQIVINSAYICSCTGYHSQAVRQNFSCPYMSISYEITTDTDLNASLNQNVIIISQNQEITYLQFIVHCRNLTYNMTDTQSHRKQWAFESDVNLNSCFTTHELYDLVHVT